MPLAVTTVEKKRPGMRPQGRVGRRTQERGNLGGAEKDTRQGRGLNRGREWRAEKPKEKAWLNGKEAEGPKRAAVKEQD